MKVDSVPVDTCANLTLVAAWETHKNHTNGKKDLKVGTFESLVHEVLLLHWIVSCLGVQPHLVEQCAGEVGGDLRHSEDLPDEEPSGGNGLVPWGTLQAEPCHQQVRNKNKERPIV